MTVDGMSAYQKESAMPKKVESRNVYPPYEIVGTSYLLSREFTEVGCDVERIGDFLYVKKSGKSCYLLETETSNTSLLAFRMLKDKVSSKKIFEKAQVSSADGYVFGKNERKAALEKIVKMGSAVIKPSDGNKGKGVSVNVTAESFEAAWSAAVNATRRKILVEKYFPNGKEARYLVIDGSCVAVHMRIPPVVYGDSVKTVSELIANKNEIRRSNPARVNCDIKIDEFRLQILQSQNLNLDSIPVFGQKVIIDWKAGLSTGGEALDITEEVHTSMKNVAERIAAAIPGLDILGVDILARDHSAEASSDSYIVVEANTRPMITGHQFPDFGRPRNVARLIAESCLRHMGLAIPARPGAAEGDGRRDEPDLADAVPCWPDKGIAPKELLIDGPTGRSPVPVDSLTLVFGGDTSLGDSYLQKRGYGAHRERLRHDPMSFFEALRPLVSDNACFIANLETVLSHDPCGPLGDVKGYLGWDEPNRTVKALKEVGITAVSLANNHTMDFGADRLVETMNHLKAGGIEYFGAGHNIAEAAQPLKLRSALGNIYIFSGFEIREKYRDVFGFYANETEPGVNPFAIKHEALLSAQIKQIRRDNPQSIIIAFPHWGGYKNYQWASKEMIEMSSSFFDAGADIVLGHGAHMMQQCVSSNAGTTIFSLGNFIYNSPGRYRKFGAPPYSCVCRLELSRAGELWAGTIRLYPFVSDNRQTDFEPRPVHEKEMHELYDLLNRKETPDFHNQFKMDKDERGWFLEPREQISRRIKRDIQSKRASN